MCVCDCGAAAQVLKSEKRVEKGLASWFQREKVSMSETDSPLVRERADLTELSFSA